MKAPNVRPRTDQPLAVHFRTDGGFGDASYAVATWHEAWAAIDTHYRELVYAQPSAVASWACEWTEGEGPRLSMHLMHLDMWEAVAEGPGELRAFCLMDDVPPWDLPSFAALEGGGTR